MKDNYVNNNELLVEDFDNLSGEDEALRFRRPKKIVKKRSVLTVLLILLGVLVIGGLTFLGFKLFGPGYVYDDSAAFYFASDLLSEEGGEFVVYDTIEFNIYNYADALRVSKEPIDNFTVSVKADGKDITGKSEIITDQTAMEPDVRTGSAVSVGVPDEYKDSVIEVAVTSSPIPKELRGSFTIEPAWGYDIRDEKGNVCAELVIFANKDVSLEFSWDEDKLIPDSTDSYVRTAENGKSLCTVELSAGMSTTVPLFKADTGDVFTKKTKAVKLKALEYTVSEEESEPTAQTEEVTE